VIIWNRIIEKARKLAEEMRDNGVFDGVSFESNGCLTTAGRGAFGFGWVIQALYEGVRRRGKVFPCITMLTYIRSKYSFMSLTEQMHGN
jgi:hypothetical protein